MDFDKLSKELDACLSEEAATEQPAAEPAEKKMTAKEFGVYAKEQVEKARKDAAAKKPEVAKKRLGALKAEVDKITKFEFKPGELPNVVIYKDEEQLDTTETEVSPTYQQADGKTNWTAKSASFGNYLEQMIKELGSNRPQDKPGAAASSTAAAGAEAGAEGGDAAVPEWPTDLAKCIKPSRADKDTDYQWGSDPR